MKTVEFSCRGATARCMYTVGLFKIISFLVNNRAASWTMHYFQIQKFLNILAIAVQHNSRLTNVYTQIFIQSFLFLVSDNV